MKKGLISFIVVAVAVLLAPSLKAEAATQEEINAIVAVFDAGYYAANNPGVVEYYGGGSELYLLNHYINYGVYEGRNPSAYFNATDYMCRYPDLQALYGNNMPSYVVHYVKWGMAEQRNGLPNNPGIVDTPKSNLKLLGMYTTEYDPKASRGHNIEVAAKNVDGKVVKPGATFSASNSIGPRTSENGFLEAPVFLNKQHAMGMGGGVCQVSSTIYAAMKTAGIQASERHAHSLPVAYLPAGWDATISWGSLDLKFVNKYDSNIIVYTMADNGKLTAALYIEN